MPTRGRPEMARQAIECFKSQTYPNRELIILDDIDDQSFPEWNNTESIRRDIASERYGIAKKRNLLNTVAQGFYICHFDSDDWSAPERIADQVERLEQTRHSVTGYNTMLFHGELDCERYMQYVGPGSYAIGTSLCYTKDWWINHPFPESKVIGEDNAMVATAHELRQLVTTDAGKLMVARIHSGNTANKYCHGTRWKKVTREDFPEAFFN